MIDPNLPEPSENDGPNPSEMPELRTPAHGNGKLLRGGIPGNRGGRPKKNVGATCLKAFQESIDNLAAIALGKSPSGGTDPTLAEQLRAIQFLCKTGMDPTTYLTEYKMVRNAYYCGYDYYSPVKKKSIESRLAEMASQEFAELDQLADTPEAAA